MGPSLLARVVAVGGSFNFPDAAAPFVPWGEMREEARGQKLVLFLMEIMEIQVWKEILQDDSLSYAP